MRVMEAASIEAQAGQQVQHPQTRYCSRLARELGCRVSRQGRLQALPQSCSTASQERQLRGTEPERETATRFSHSLLENQE